MKITFAVLTLCLGGAQRMLAEIANGLVARGHAITILMPVAGVIEYPVHAAIQRTQGFFPQSDEFPVSDVLVSTWYALVPFVQTASEQGKGIHVRFSLCYEPTFLPDNQASLDTYHVTNHVIVLSHWHQQIIYLNHGIQGHVVPVGVSSTFQNNRTGLPNKSVKICAMLRKPEGGFSAHRGQNELVMQLQYVKAQYPEVQVMLFTPPNELYESPMLQHLVATLPFTFYTPKDDIELCYHLNQADIFVTASSYDSGSIPGLEAMKCGCALVAVYAGGNLDYCRHEENCLLSYRYEHRLKSDMERLIDNAALRRKLAATGEKDAGEWTWRRSVLLFEKALQEICG